MLSYTHDITAGEYCGLRGCVGWTPIPEDQAASGLSHSDFVVACRDGGGAVGCARVFWDKGYIAYLADVMVRPEYRGRGIGTRLVSECIGYIDGQLKDGWRVKIVIVSAKGKEGFYERFGFRVRPNDANGAGMDLWRERSGPAGRTEG